MGFNDQQIRAMAGHPDAVPAVVIEAFLQGFRRCEEEYMKSSLNTSCKLDTKTDFYKNCKRQRKVGAKICQCCPFRKWIEEQEAQYLLAESILGQQ